MSQLTFNEKFRKRTQTLSVEIIGWYASLKHKPDEVRIMGKQLIRSTTSTAANFRAACRARSRIERFSKLSIVVEESDETVFWIELFQQLGIVNPDELVPMHNEALEILKVETWRKNLKTQ